jgi:predicted RNA polymerase sigma factor
VSGDAEVAGLLALMLLTDARRPARTRADGSIVPLAEQDRDRWDKTMIGEGIALITRTLGTAPPGPYQLQAAIAAVHDEAPSDAETDWPQILALYGALEAIAPSPVVTLNRAVALARVEGPRAALDLLASVESDKGLARGHRLDAVRGHLLEQEGEHKAAARQCYLRAARTTASIPERDYLTLKAAELNLSGDVENGESTPTKG